MIINKEEKDKADALLKTMLNVTSERKCYAKEIFAVEINKIDNDYTRIEYMTMFPEEEGVCIFNEHLRLVARVIFGFRFYREWWNYDDQGRETKYTNSDGKMVIQQYHDNGKVKQKSEVKYKQVVKVEKGYEFNEPQMICESFYNKDGNKIHTKDSDGKETWYDYDELGRNIHTKDSDGKESWTEYPEGYDGDDTFIVKYSDGSEFVRTPFGGYATNNAAAFFGTK